MGSRNLKKKTIYTLAFLGAVCATSASADFNRWGVDVESDPFTGGKSVSASYSFSIRSAVIVLCDSATNGLRVRMVPGWRPDGSLDGYEAIVQRDFAMAVDGNIVRLVPAKAHVGTVGNQQTASDVVLQGNDSIAFLEAFSAAQKQIAFKDGISDSPLLASAKGSTKAAQSLSSCLNSQPK